MESSNDTDWSLETRLAHDIRFSNGRELEVNEMVVTLHTALIRRVGHEKMSRKDELEFLENVDLGDYFAAIKKTGERYGIQKLVAIHAAADRKLLAWYKAWVRARIEHSATDSYIQTD